MSRRPRRTVFGVFLNRVARRLRGGGPPERELIIDGKPLPVGHRSKDPDARSGGQGRGYKLHALWGSSPWPAAWEPPGFSKGSSELLRPRP